MLGGGGGGVVLHLQLIIRPCNTKPYVSSPKACIKCSQDKQCNLNISAKGLEAREEKYVLRFCTVGFGFTMGYFSIGVACRAVRYVHPSLLPRPGSTCRHFRVPTKHVLGLLKPGCDAKGAIVRCCGAR